jgi:hypothetical protein
MLDCSTGCGARGALKTNCYGKEAMQFISIDCTATLHHGANHAIAVEPQAGHCLPVLLGQLLLLPAAAAAAPALLLQPQLQWAFVHPTLLALTLPASVRFLDQAALLDLL